MGIATVHPSPLVLVYVPTHCAYCSVFSRSLPAYSPLHPVRLFDQASQL